jgi:hypothetical protein
MACGELLSNFSLIKELIKLSIKFLIKIRLIVDGVNKVSVRIIIIGVQVGRVQIITNKILANFKWHFLEIKIIGVIIFKDSTGSTNNKKGNSSKLSKLIKKIIFHHLRTLEKYFINKLLF